MKHSILPAFFISLILIFSQTASALPSQYRCDGGRYQVDLDLTGDTSTHLWLTDLNQSSVLEQGYAKSIVQKNDHTQFVFYFSEGEMKLTVQNDDVSSLPDFFRAKILGTVQGLILRTNLDCQKRN